MEKNIEDILALTPTQEGILFHYLKEPLSDQYVEQLSFRTVGDIDMKRFEGAWSFVVNTNEMLRTRFMWKKVKKPVQIILRKFELNITYYDFSDMDMRESDKRLEEIKDKDRKKGFDLQNIPFRLILCKLGKNSYELIISNHHILYDGWSNGIILKEFLSAYNDLYYGRTPDKPQKRRYREYVKWIRRRDKKKEEKFWEEYLEGYDSEAELLVKKKNETSQRKAQQYHFKFARGLRSKLEDCARKYKITPASIFYASWGILLQKYKHSNDVVFGTIASGRSAKVAGIENIVGLFVNTLPLRVKTGSNSNERALDIICEIDNILRNREGYEDSFSMNQNSRKKLFESIVVIENYPLDKKLVVENVGLYFKSYSMVEKDMTDYDLSIAVTLFEEIEVFIVYDRELFNTETIMELSDHFTKIVTEIVRCPEKLTAEIELVSTEEMRQIISEIEKKNEDIDIQFDL